MLRKSICVVIPCYNEGVTIKKVIKDFKTELPDADIIVINNNSTDDSEEIAINNGAKVIREPRQGKGFVVEKIVKELDYDIYIMVDGDDTYPANKIHDLLKPIIEQKADIVVGSRLQHYSTSAFKKFHKLGNNLVRFLVNFTGDANLRDIMSGYRVFTRDLAKKIPIISSGFEIETELTIQMLYYNVKIVEIDVPYKERPEGSFSKLNTYKDGFRVVSLIFRLLRTFKPLYFFSLVSMVFLTFSLIAGYFPIYDYLNNPNHYVEHVPLAILASGLALISIGTFFVGILLHTINYRIKELHSVITRNL